MLMKQVDHNGRGDNVRLGDSLIEDRFAGGAFDYFLTTPPFGVDWKRQQGEVRREHEQRGFAGRFGAGLPRVNDGSLLFLQHMIAKFEPVRPKEHKHGSRLAIVFSGSPLFTGGAGSGESNIRRWIIENDWLEAIVALPEQMFYNTGIGTYVWIVTNRKEKRRRGRIQLLDARDLWTPGGSAESRRSLGDKRRHLSAGQIDEIVRLYGRFREGGRSKIFRNADFGYTRVTVERPLRLRYRMTIDDKARFLDACPFLLDDVQVIDKALGRKPMRDWNAVWEHIADLLHERGSRWKKVEQRLFRDVFTHKDPEAEPVTKGGREEGFEPDTGLRDFENVPLTDDVGDYFEREVRPRDPRRRLWPVPRARARHAAREDGARPAPRRHRSRDGGAVHRQALRERKGRGRRLLAACEDHLEAEQSRVRAHRPDRQGRGRGRGGGGAGGSGGGKRCDARRYRGNRQWPGLKPGRRIGRDRLGASLQPTSSAR